MRRFAKTAGALPGRTARAVGKAALRPVVATRSAVRSLFTPFRLVLLAIVTVAVATGYWVWQGRQAEQAATALRRAVEQGDRALAAGDFEAAYESFRIAAGAVKELGRDDPQARSLVQTARELEAATHLAANPLSTIADEFVDNRKNGDERAVDAFRILHGGRWVVIDANLVRTLLPGGAEGLIFDFPLTAGEEQCILDANIPRLRALAASTPRRVIFAGQLESCQPLGPAGAPFAIRFRPETAFLWCDVRTLMAVGFTPEDGPARAELEALLAQQRSVMGLEP